MRLKYGVEITIFFYAVILYAGAPSVILQTQAILCKQMRPANNTDPNYCNSDDVTASTSTFTTKYSVASAIPALFTVTAMAGISDCKGRKLALVLPLIGTFVQYITNLLVAVFDYPIEILYAGQVAYGLGGTYAAILMAFFASISDTVAPEQRTSAMGRVEGALLAGLSIGSILSGIIIDKFGYVVLFSSLEVMVAILLVLVIVQDETLPRENRPQLTWRRVNVYRVMSWLWYTPTTAILSLAFLISVGVMIGMVSPMVLYVRHVFNISAELNGYFQATGQVARALGLLLILPVIFRRARHNPLSQIFWAGVSMLVCTVQTLLYALLTQALWVFFALCSLGLLSMWGTVVTRGLMSRIVPQDAQGALMGAIGVLEGCIMPFLGAMILNSTYTATVHGFAGSFALVGAGMYLICVFLFIWLNARVRRNPAELSALTNDDEAKPLLAPVDNEKKKSINSFIVKTGDSPEKNNGYNHDNVSHDNVSHHHEDYNQNGNGIN